MIFKIFWCLITEENYNKFLRTYNVIAQSSSSAVASFLLASSFIEIWFLCKKIIMVDGFL